MIGVFLKNEEGKLCFVQPPKSEKPEIAAFHYQKDSHMIVITLVDGHEETITTEIAPDMRDAFLKETHILVANLDDESKLEREYRVPLIP